MNQTKQLQGESQHYKLPFKVKTSLKNRQNDKVVYLKFAVPSYWTRTQIDCI